MMETTLSAPVGGEGLAGGAGMSIGQRTMEPTHISKRPAAMTPADVLLPTCRQMLGTLSAWLTKAQARDGDGGDGDAILSARLAPDMFPLSTQVRFACVQAREAICRLMGQDFPESLTELLDEGRNGGDHPGTIAQAKTRIDETIAVLDALLPGALEGDANRPIAHALPTGMTFDLTAEQYVRDWTLPQFYFHLMIAYAILRREGVDLGKADYVMHMFAYLRPGTMPAG